MTLNRMHLHFTVVMCIVFLIITIQVTFRGGVYNCIRLWRRVKLFNETGSVNRNNHRDELHGLVSSSSTSFPQDMVPIFSVWNGTATCLVLFWPGRFSWPLYCDYLLFLLHIISIISATAKILHILPWSSTLTQFSTNLYLVGIKAQSNRFLQ